MQPHLSGTRCECVMPHRQRIHTTCVMHCVTSLVTSRRCTRDAMRHAALRAATRDASGVRFSGRSICMTEGASLRERNAESVSCLCEFPPSVPRVTKLGEVRGGGAASGGRIGEGGGRVVPLCSDTRHRTSSVICFRWGRPGRVKGPAPLTSRKTILPPSFATGIWSPPWPICAGASSKVKSPERCGVQSRQCVYFKSKSEEMSVCACVCACVSSVCECTVCVYREPRVHRLDPVT